MVGPTGTAVNGILDNYAAGVRSMSLTPQEGGIDQGTKRMVEATHRTPAGIEQQIKNMNAAVDSAASIIHTITTGNGFLRHVVAADYSVPPLCSGAEVLGNYELRNGVYVASGGGEPLPTAAKLYKHLTGKKLPQAAYFRVDNMPGTMKGAYDDTERQISVLKQHPVLELITAIHEYAHAAGKDEKEAVELMFRAIGYLKDNGYAGMRRLESGLIIPENMPSRLERLAA